ncbi:DsbA family protein [Delftia sp. PS-11]|uniref:DsbA family protein n=1 Tax=Delftia sp. PS-11 TaxID=2767222 RepID=UPI0024577739|nr:DsbA family protein [Delftia sp. PS-11]KAJ8744317.1 DsbA family protein [Delftia sp. PS-11]
MNALHLPLPSIVYAMDAYCGWCWGFCGRMGEFEAANRHRVAFTAISGGLFVGERARPLADYPYIPEANARIARLTGAVFGSAYNGLFSDGSMVMDSLDAGAALAVLRAQAPHRAVHWAHELQAAFYGRGLSLSDPATVAGIAEANGLDVAAVLHGLQSGAGKALAQADFALARQLGVASYPTLLWVDGATVRPLPATGTALGALNQQLDALLAGR